MTQGETYVCVYVCVCVCVCVWLCIHMESPLSEFWSCCSDFGIKII